MSPWEEGYIMRNLTKPTLNIKRGAAGTNTWNVTVSGDVLFEKDQLDAMKKGHTYKLKCILWGRDVTSDDDFLYRFPSKQFPHDGNAHDAKQHYVFSATLSNDVLDEDDWPSGYDDIYAKLKLRDLEIHRTIGRRVSNEVDGDF